MSPRRFCESSWRLLHPSLLIRGSLKGTGKMTLEKESRVRELTKMIAYERVPQQPTRFWDCERN